MTVIWRSAPPIIAAILALTLSFGCSTPELADWAPEYGEFTNRRPPDSIDPTVGKLAPGDDGIIHRLQPLTKDAEGPPNPGTGCNDIVPELNRVGKNSWKFGWNDDGKTWQNQLVYPAHFVSTRPSVQGFHCIGVIQDDGANNLGTINLILSFNQLGEAYLSNEGGIFRPVGRDDETGLTPSDLGFLWGRHAAP